MGLKEITLANRSLTGIVLFRINWTIRRTHRFMRNQTRAVYLRTTVPPAGKMALKYLGVVLAVAGLAIAASAEDITIHLSQNASTSRKTVQYLCDAEAAKMGLPSGPFSVEYINGGGNSLVVVPVSGNSLIFANVISGSGARYAAQQFIWWEAKGTVTVYSDALTGKLQSACRPVQAKP